MIDLCAEDATILYAASDTRFIPLRVGNAGEWLRTMPLGRSRSRGGRSRVRLSQPCLDCAKFYRREEGIPVTHLRQIMLQELERRNYAPENHPLLHPHR